MRDIAPAYFDALAAAVRRSKLGPSDDADFGTLTSQAQLDHVLTHVQDAVANGANILVGGAARPDLGPFAFEPTILTEVTPDMRCFADETFGALAYVTVVDSVDEAIALANDSTYGLNASVFGGDIVRARRVAEQLEAGSVNINEGYRASFSAVDAPMGGVKQSGLGRRNGREGLLRFVEPVTIAWPTGLLHLPTTAADFAVLGPIMLLAMRALKAFRIR